MFYGAAPHPNIGVTDIHSKYKYTIFHINCTHGPQNRAGYGYGDTPARIGHTLGRNMPSKWRRRSFMSRFLVSLRVKISWYNGISKPTTHRDAQSDNIHTVLRLDIRCGRGAEHSRRFGPHGYRQGSHENRRAGTLRTMPGDREPHCTAKGQGQDKRLRYDVVLPAAQR